MENALSCVFLVFLYCGLALGARTKLLATDGASPLAQSADDGMCKLRVTIYGYGCEEHTVTTQDGYILSVQRIPADRSGVKGTMPPVLLQHGVLMDGMTWLLNAPEESLGYILADNGFDVWIANTRGTTFSRGHTSLSPDDSAYWQWSWDELVADELPALVQYVHDQTGQQLHYIGHSLGTLMALVSFSQGKVFDKLRSAALLSPIAHLGQITSPLARTGSKLHIAEDLYKLGVAEFAPKGKAVAKILKVICSKPGVDCYDLMTAFTGKNCCLNATNSEVFIDNEPQSTATKNMIHIAQMVRDSTIAMFDYGDDNMKHYGQSTPPAYSMSSIPNDFPLYLHYGGADALSDVADVKILLDDLKDHDADKLVVEYEEDYAHADFVMAVNADQVVYEPLMAFFKLH